MKYCGELSRIFSCITVAPSEFISMMVLKRILCVIHDVIEKCDTQHFEYVLLTLSNIASSTPKHIFDLLELQIFDKVCTYFETHADEEDLYASFVLFASKSMQAEYLNNAAVVK